jgi:conjugal transfer/entry exclusion protein
MNNMQTVDQLKVQIEDFYIELLQGNLDNLPNLAKALQGLADKAWDKVEEL